MKKLSIALSVALLPIFVHADGELAAQTTQPTTNAQAMAPSFMEARLDAMYWLA